MCACVPGRCLSAFVSPVCTRHLLYLMSTEFQADPLCVGIQPDSGERVAPTTKPPPPTDSPRGHTFHRAELALNVEEGGALRNTKNRANSPVLFLTYVTSLY